MNYCLAGILLAVVGCSLLPESLLGPSMQVSPPAPQGSFSFAPQAGTWGDTVSLFGIALNGAPQVYFQGATASVVQLQNQTLRVTVPKGAQTGPIRVASGGALWGSEKAYWVASSLALTAPRPDVGYGLFLPLILTPHWLFSSQEASNNYGSPPPLHWSLDNPAAGTIQSSGFLAGQGDSLVKIQAGIGSLTSNILTLSVRPPRWRVTTLAGAPEAGYVDGASTEARFSSPSGIAVDASGRVFVADKDNHRIRAISPLGVVTTFAGSGRSGDFDGSMQDALFNQPAMLAWDQASHSLYVADLAGVRRVMDGSVTTVRHPDKGYSFSAPMALLPDTTLVAWDPVARCFVKVSSNGSVSDWFGGFSTPPTALAIDAFRIFVVQGHRLWRVIDEASVQFAGDEIPGYLNDLGIMARFDTPQGIVLDEGCLYVADAGNHCLRQIALANLDTVTLAGHPVPKPALLSMSGYVDGEAQQARFSHPSALAIAPDGAIYVADTGNHCIRKVFRY